MGSETDKLKNFIPINRRVFEHPFWNEKREYSKFEAWIDLLKSARFDEGEDSMIVSNQTVVWSRGEMVASLRFLAERWQWSKKKVDNFMKRLESDKSITRRTAKGTVQTIVTICKYDTYNKSIKLGGQQGDSKGTVGGQSGDKYNIDNKVNIDKSITSPKKAGENFNFCKEYFLGYYKEQCKSDYYFEAKDGKKLTTIIKKIETKVKSKFPDKNQEAINDSVKKGFSSFIRKSYEQRDSFLENNFNLSIIDSKFNDLYTKITKPKDSVAAATTKVYTENKPALDHATR